MRETFRTINTVFLWALCVFGTLWTAVEGLHNWTGLPGELFSSDHWSFSAGDKASIIIMAITGMLLVGNLFATCVRSPRWARIAMGGINALLAAAYLLRGIIGIVMHDRARQVGALNWLPVGPDWPLGIIAVSALLGFFAISLLASQPAEPAGDDVPTTPRSFARLDSLDLLRGIAILGIFLMNTWTMSMPQNAYTNPATYTPDYVEGKGFRIPEVPSAAPVRRRQTEAEYTQELALKGSEYWTFVAIHEFADMKFITMFSMMFGAGIILQGQRAAARGLSPWRIHYGRMAVLLLIGLAHAYGLWYGDILTTYAVCGLLLFPLRRIAPTALAGLGIVLILGATFINLNSLLGWGITPIDRLDRWSDVLWQRAHVDPATSMPDTLTADTPVAGNDTELRAYRGSWLTQMRHRAWESFRAQTVEFLTWDFLRCGGSILVGMALLRLRFFHGEWSRGAYAALAMLLIPIGWIVTYLGVVFMDHIGWKNAWETSDPVFSVWGLGVEFNYWGSLITELGYLACGVLLALWAANPARRLLRKCLVPIRSIGRMALTCYILETLIGTTLFYGHGFGLFGKLFRSQQLWVVAGTWAVLLIIAPLWLRFFRQGPLEWLWHRIVYWRGEPPPLKDPTEAAAST